MSRLSKLTAVALSTIGASNSALMSVNKVNSLYAREKSVYNEL